MFEIAKHLHSSLNKAFRVSRLSYLTERGYLTRVGSGLTCKVQTWSEVIEIAKHASLVWQRSKVHAQKSFTNWDSEKQMKD